MKLENSPSQTIRSKKKERTICIRYIFRGNHQSSVIPFNMEDIINCLQPFLDIPNVKEEEIEITEINFHYSLVMKHSPLQYISLLNRGDANPIFFIRNPETGEQLTAIDYTKNLTEHDIKAFGNLKPKNVLLLGYTIDNTEETFGYKVTASQLLDIKFIRFVIDESMKAFFKLPRLENYNSPELPDSERHNSSKQVYNKTEALINELAEKLLAKTNQIKLALSSVKQPDN